MRQCKAAPGLLVVLVWAALASSVRAYSPEPLAEASEAYSSA